MFCFLTKKRNKLYPHHGLPIDLYTIYNLQSIATDIHSHISLIDSTARYLVFYYANVEFQIVPYTQLKRVVINDFKIPVRHPHLIQAYKPVECYYKLKH